MGFEATKSQIYPAGWGTKNYLRTNYPDIKKIFLSGVDAFYGELKKLDLEIIRGNDLDIEINSLEDLALETDPDI